MFWRKKQKSDKPKTFAEAEAIIKEIDERVAKRSAIKLARYAIDNNAPKKFVEIAINRLFLVGESEMAKELARKYDIIVLTRDNYFEFKVDDI